MQEGRSHWNCARLAGLSCSKKMALRSNVDTAIKGGVISAAQAAVDAYRNQFSIGIQASVTNIENHDHCEVESGSVKLDPACSRQSRLAHNLQSPYRHTSFSSVLVGHRLLGSRADTRICCCSLRRYQRRSVCQTPW